MRRLFGSSGDRTARRLQAIGRDVAALRGEKAVLDEQVVFLQQVAADAETDAIVAGHGPAQREGRAAQSDLGRARRQRDALEERIQRLLGEQDSLLEQMLD